MKINLSEIKARAEIDSESRYSDESEPARETLALVAAIEAMAGDIAHQRAGNADGLGPGSVANILAEHGITTGGEHE